MAAEWGIAEEDVPARAAANLSSLQSALFAAASDSDEPAGKELPGVSAGGGPSVAPQARSAGVADDLFEDHSESGESVQHTEAGGSDGEPLVDRFARSVMAGGGAEDSGAALGCSEDSANDMSDLFAELVAAAEAGTEGTVAYAFIYVSIYY